jgi:hypothetical protein
MRPFDFPRKKDATMSTIPSNFSTAQQALRAARQQVADAATEAATLKLREAHAKILRDQLVSEATLALAELRTQLFSVFEDVPRSTNRSEEFCEGAGKFKIGKVLPGPQHLIEQIGDVVAWAPLQLHCATQLKEYTWSSTLVFARPVGSTEYRWMEIAFFNHPFSREQRDAPYGLDPSTAAFSFTLSNCMHTHCIAYGPTPIDRNDTERFIACWTSRFATAIQGKFTRPSSMPLAA